MLVFTFHACMYVSVYEFVRSVLTANECSVWPPQISAATPVGAVTATFALCSDSSVLTIRLRAYGRLGLLTRSSLEKIWHFHFADARMRIRIPEQERFPRPTHARKKYVSSLAAEVKYTLLRWIKLTGVVTYDASVHVTVHVYMHVWKTARSTNSACACACACAYVCVRARMSMCVNAHWKIDR